jgi:Domain of unknown function (DUF4340)
MKDRGTYLLLALFFAGLLGLWVADYSRVPTRAQRDHMSNRVLTALVETKPDDLLKIEILGGDEPIVFERDGNRWQMTSPMNVAADPSKVETLAYNLKELTRRPESATLDPDLTRYGLDHPERTLKLWGAATDAPLATLEVGRASLDRRYVRAVGSEGVEVVDAKGLDPLIKLPAVRWRDHELFRVPSFEVDSVNIASQGRALKLKRSRGAWHVIEPFRLLAAEARVDGLIADLGSLRVMGDDRFVKNDVKPADLDQYGLKTPALTIEINSSRADRRTGPQILEVGKPVEGKDGQVYARRGDQNDVVIVDQRVLKDLKPEPNVFRSPKVADINPGRVIRIRVEDDAGGTIEAARYGNEWAIVAPSTAKGDRQAIQDFLKSLDQLQTQIYLTPSNVPDSGLNKPSLTLKVWQIPDSSGGDPKGDLAMVLRIGRREAARKVIYAQIEGDPTILALPDNANSFLPRNPLAFRDRQVLSVDVDRIEQVRFVSPSRKITLRAPIFKIGRQNMGLAPTGWWMVEPVATPADAPSIGKLLRLLSSLRAESLVTEKPASLDNYGGLKTPALTVTWSAPRTFSMVEKPSTVESSSGTIAMEELSLIIGSPLPDRPSIRYAKLGDYPLIFTLGPDVLGVLDAEWRDHSVLTFEPDRVRKVRLEWPDRSLSLAPTFEDGSRKWAPEEGQVLLDFDAGPVAAIVKAASNLSTSRFLQYEGDILQGIGLAPARLALRFELDNGSSRVLKLGAADGRGQLLATTEPGTKGPIFVIAESPFAPVMKAPRRKDDLPDNVFAP